jgi:DNA-binding protein HU-beta
MTKGDLINAVAKAAKTSKRAAEEAVNATFANLGKAIKRTKRVQVPGFGTFSVRLRKARNGRNPQTGVAIKIKASRTVGFKPAPNLKKGL